MAASAKQPSTVSPVRAALAGRCPGCGKGKLFSGFLKVADKCEDCGLDFSRHDSADGPAVFVILILGFVVVGLALWVELAFGPPFWLHLVMWLPLVIFVGVAMLRPIKAVLIGLQYKHRREDYHDDSVT